MTRCAAAGAASAAEATSAAPINANLIACSSVDDDENMGQPDTFRQLDFCNAGQAFLAAFFETLACALHRSAAGDLQRCWLRGSHGNLNARIDLFHLSSGGLDK
jgi:hypothetical protein